MNSKERVIAVFSHEIPDRVPCWCGASPEFWLKAKETLGLDDEALRIRMKDDFRRVSSTYQVSQDNLPEGAVYRTVFGIERAGLGYGQPLEHPLADSSIGQIHEYNWPSPDLADISSIAEQAEPYKQEYAILGGEWSPFWHDAIDLVGMENLYLMMHLEPQKADALFTHIVDFYFEVSKRIFDQYSQYIDIFFIGNDFGSQTGPLMSPQAFERFMVPHLKRLTDLGHSYGLKVQMHCCGGIAELIPAMIKAGLDGLHALQPDCRGMDLARLKEDFGDQIVLNGGIDSHHVLIDGTPERVEQKTRDVLKTMKPGGGYIAGASHDTILEETPVENIIAMFDAIYQYGSYE